MLNPVGPARRFDETVPAPYAGQFVKDADASLIDVLAASGRLELVVDYTHSYPHCWRCEHAAHLLGEAEMVRTHVGAQGRPAPRERADRLAPRAHPRGPLRRLAREQRRLGARRVTGSGARRSRCGAAATAATTCASVRSPSSVPLPVAISPSSTSTVRSSTTSASSARSAAGRRTVSNRCSTRGSTRARCRPAQLHHPFENATSSSSARFPADFICEAIDQTRGWFYSLLAVNTLVFGRAPYRNVVCLGLIVSARRPEDVEVEGQRDRPVVDHRPAAPTPSAGTSSRPARRGAPPRPADDRRSHPPVPAHAVEHLLVLRDLRAARRMGYPAPKPIPRHTWIAGSDRGSRHRRRGHGGARRLRRAASRAGAGVLRRRAVELVRATVTRTVLEGRRPAAHATLHRCLAPSPSSSLRSARSSPTRCGVNLTGSTTESVHLATGPWSTSRAHDPARARMSWRGSRVARAGRARRVSAPRRPANRCPERSCCSPVTIGDAGSPRSPMS